jgi:hypothetical protein
MKGKTGMSSLSMSQARLDRRIRGWKDPRRTEAHVLILCQISRRRFPTQRGDSLSALLVGGSVLVKDPVQFGQDRRTSGLFQMPAVAGLWGKRSLPPWQMSSHRTSHNSFHLLSALIRSRVRR